MKKALTMAMAILTVGTFLGLQNVLQANAYIANFNSAAEIVIGQGDMSSNQPNQGGSISATTANSSCRAFILGTKLFVADTSNHRVLIYNTIPTANNTAADVVIGQADMTHNSANQGVAAAANTLKYPADVITDGTKLIISDFGNNRVLIYNTIPTTNNAVADVVIGQADMTHNSANQGVAASANTLRSPYGIYFNGTKLFVADNDNNRVLIYNTLPSANNASANVVVGQENMTNTGANKGGSASESTLNEPLSVWADNDKLIVGDFENNRVLIYNSIPTSNNASANVVVGQPDMTSVTANQGVSASAVTLDQPHGVFVYNSKLYVSDYENSRVLVYNSIPSANNVPADAVIGQADMTSTTLNRGGAAGANTLNKPNGIFVSATRLVIADRENNRILLYDNQDVTASPSTLNYSKSKGKSKTVTLYVYGLSVSKTKKKYYTARIGGKAYSVKSVKKESGRVKVKVKFKYGKKARGSYNVSVRYKQGSTNTTRSADSSITIQ